ncbi:four helix bundle protein [Echinicola sediminis]
MAKVERFEDLKIWQESIQLGVRIYALADKAPLAKDYRSRDQLIAAAISISNNIAEGFEYNSNRTFRKFLYYAKGSAGEVRSQLALLEKAERISTEEYESLKNELIILSSRIKAFINYLDNYEKK